MTTNQPAERVGAPAVTDEMIEAGVVALQRSGFGNEEGESTNQLRQAVEEVFLAMAATSRPSQTRLEK
jgi:hypothetical protein